MKKLLNHWLAARRRRPAALPAGVNDDWLRRLREAGL